MDKSYTKFASYYTVLQLIDFADEAAIKGAYKHLSQKWHPDRNPNCKPGEERKIKQINEAYRILSNPVLKANYDQKLRESKNNEDGNEKEIHDKKSKSKEYRASETKKKSKRSVVDNSPIFKSGGLLWFVLFAGSVVFAVFVIKSEFYDMPAYVLNLKSNGVEGTGTYIGFVKEIKNTKGKHRGYVYQVALENRITNIKTYAYLPKFGSTFPIVYDRNSIFSQIQKNGFFTSDFYIGRKNSNKSELNWAKEGPGDTKDRIVGIFAILGLVLYLSSKVISYSALVRRLFNSE